jgi:hypothetical protein
MTKVNLEEINKLLKERDELLLSNPELIAFQEEVDGLMEEKKDESPLLRSLRLNKMMLENLNKSYLETLSIMEKRTLGLSGEH